MATNLSLDPALIEQALAVSGERTKKAAVTRAHRDIVAMIAALALNSGSRRPYWCGEPV
jgi:hypothetical protein